MVRASRRFVAVAAVVALGACATSTTTTAPTGTTATATLPGSTGSAGSTTNVTPATATTVSHPSTTVTEPVTTVPSSTVPLPTVTTTPSSVATTTLPAVVAAAVTTSPATSAAPTNALKPTRVTLPADAPRPVGASGAVTMTAVPADLIVPTGPDSLAAGTNPINGRRGGSHPLDEAGACTTDDPVSEACVTVALDSLGLAVTGGAPADAARRRSEAIEVLQLDAGFPATGHVDEALLRYLGVWPGTDAAGALEVRPIGASGRGRPLTAYRYGSGPRVVLVVAQTHGDEEGGRRVWLRARQRGVPAGVTLWVVPTLNPDGLALDTRFLADGADPNRKAGAEPEQRAVIDLANAVRPELTVWFHQNYGWIGGSGASMAPASRYHQLTGLGPLYRSGDCALGFMWCPIDDALGSSSILVELPDVVTPADVQTHADALLAVVRDGGA